jgi:AmmeMemoRadiSam system protein A
VVGYGAWALYEPAAAGVDDTDGTIMADDPERTAIDAVADVLLAITRHAILIGLDTGQPPRFETGPGLPPLLSAPGAAFVTLKRFGALRGCIGSPMAWRPLLHDVANHAYNAAFKDPRFPPLYMDELQGLSLSVSVLTQPVPMTFGDEAELLAQLRPGMDGLIIEDAGRRSLFLPSVWEEIAEPRRFLRLLKQKAGLPEAHFSPTFTAQRFRAIEVKGEMAQPNADVLPRQESRVQWRPYQGPETRWG